MNFLSHFQVALQSRPERASSSLYIAGTVLPDLLSLTGGPRLRSAGAYGGDVADGVRLHLDVDAWFHASPTFARAQSEVTALLAGGAFAVPVRRRYLAAHVIVELALDALIQHKYPDLPDAFYAHLDSALETGLIDEAARLTGQPVPELEKGARALIARDFLRDYLAPERFAAAVARAYRRVGVDSFTDPADRAALEAVIVESISLLGPYREGLLAFPSSFRTLSDPVVQ